MFYSTRSKLIANFLGVAFLVGIVSLLVGARLLYSSVLNEALNHVRLDLNAAREIYQERVEIVRVSLNVTTLGLGFLSDLKGHNTGVLSKRLTRVAQYAGLDFAGIVTSDDKILCRIGPNPIPIKALPSTNPISNLALKRELPVSGTFLLSNRFLSSENPELAARARILLAPESGADPAPKGEETLGMAIAAAIPVFNGSELLGVLYGGILLNRKQSLVDTIRDTLFLDETYEGRGAGRVSIFLQDIRIATNVLTQSEKRAIGTRVSKEVKEHVLGEGEKWTERAFVVNDWYITSYEPIEDVSGNRIGILGLGVLEKKYLDIRMRVLTVFIMITIAGMAVAVGLGYILARKIMRPVRRLIKASQQVSDGSLSPDIGPISKDEIGVLQKNFTEMVAAMGRRRAESQNKLLQSEKQASVGRLAAGVAHEINNPLTGVLTYSHMLLRRKDLNDDVRADLQTIVNSTERVRKIVKGLLDFSRQTELDREPTDVNKAVGFTILLMKNQALVKGVSIKFSPAKSPAVLTLDRSQFQSVLINLILNALDATEAEGNITVSTGISLSEAGPGHKGVEIVISDTGSGIPAEDLDKLFDPFFTTKDVGQGTGLGLSVSLGIIQRHGGTIRVQSEVGKGSTFIIWLPIEEQDE